MRYLLPCVVLPMLFLSSGGCTSCPPGGPSGPSREFIGSVSPAGLVFHDVAVPSNTDSVNVTVQWTPGDAQLQLIQIDPGCDPTGAVACTPRTDPQQPLPGGPQNVISGYLNHQGVDATGRVRFVIRNVTAGVTATYSASATPRRHGCDR